VPNTVPPALTHRALPLGVVWLLLAGLALTVTAAMGWWWLSDPAAASPGQARQAGDTSAPTAVNDERSAVLPPASAADSAASRVLSTVAPAAAVEQGPPPATPPASPPSRVPAAIAEPVAREQPPVPGVSTRPTPRKNSPNPRCTDIIARVSLGEELSAQDHATLERECRK